MSEYTKILKKYSSADIIKIIAALELLPTNHGKNVRFELLADMVLANWNNNNVSVPIQKFKKVLEKEFPKHKDEDPTVELFTENVMFVTGNYIVFPGITDGGTIVLNSLIKTIFIADYEKRLPEPFKKKIYSAFSLMLHIFNEVALRAGLSRNAWEKIKRKQIEIPTEKDLRHLQEALTFKTEWVMEKCKELEISPGIIKEFIVPVPSSSNPNNKILKTKPLLHIEDEYFVAQPISSVHCLINFLWNQAKEYDCYDTLLNLHHESVWEDVQRQVYKMQLLPLPCDLPEQPKDMYCKEGVFILDLNKLAYICLLGGGHKHSSPDFDGTYHEKLSDSALQYSEMISKRQNEIIAFLKNTYPDESLEVFSLYVVTETGFPEQFGFPDTTKDNIGLWFRFSELKHITDFEEPDPLLLWKFAKHFNEVQSEYKIHCISGNLDVFAVYKHNHYTLWPKDDKRQDIAIMPGWSASYIKQSTIDMDEHLAPFQEKDRSGFKFIYHYFPYAPIYREAGFSRTSPLLIENYKSPIWFINLQEETQHEVLINSQLEMVAYWMYKLQLHLEKDFYFLEKNKPLNIIIKLDERYKRELRIDEVFYVPLEDINIPIEIADFQVTLTIPLEMAWWYSRPNNDGERYLMLHFVKSIILAKTGLDRGNELREIIAKEFPVGSGKLSSMLGNMNSLKLEKRNLGAYRPIQEADTEFVKLNLTRAYGVTVEKSDLFSKESKNKLCNKIADALYKELKKKLLQYDCDHVLPILLNNHEACVQKKAERPLDLVPKISLMSSRKRELSNLVESEIDRAKTTLVIRILIELIVALNPSVGKEKPGFDEVDELIALTSEMVDWSILSDTIHLGLNDPQIKFQKSGRIDADYQTFNSNIIPFTVKRNEIELNNYVRNYDYLFEPSVEVDYNNLPETIIEINKVFKTDVGIELLKLHEFLLDIVELIRNNNGSVICIPEDSLYQELRKSRYKWTDDEISACLNFFTLISSWEIGIPPIGYPKEETYLWRYNRALSFLYRPIVKLTKENTTFYYWGYRHLLASYEHIVSRLFDGRLPSKKHGVIDKFMAKVRHSNGKDFRSQVLEWLKANSDLQVIEQEVRIRPNAKLNAQTDLGDIDILAIDHAKKIIYSIECKNTVDSKSMHEMKTEMDNYLGKNGNDGLIQKHLKRDKWLRENRDALNIYVNNADDYTIHSLVVTSEDIPLPYLNENKLLLPFISFPRLEMD